MCYLFVFIFLWTKSYFVGVAVAIFFIFLQIKISGYFVRDCIMQRNACIGIKFKCTYHGSHVVCDILTEII